MTMPAFAETDYVAKYGIKEDIPGACSYASIDAKDYTGHEITILTHAVPVMGEPVALHSKQFEELTGGAVNVVHAPFGELYHKVMIPFQTGQHVYDIVYGGSYWIGDWAPHLAPVPQKYLDTDEMKDITPSYQGVASWNGQRLQYTFDGDRNYFKYILPPFDDAENQAKFKAEYGRDLAVPTTWEEYAEVATFFSGWDWDGDGELEYGSTEIVKRDDVAFANFITRVASYAKNPNVTRRLLVRSRHDDPAGQQSGLRQGARDVDGRAPLHAAGRYQLWHRRRDLLLGRRPIADERDLGRRLHSRQCSRIRRSATRSASVPSTAPPWARTRCGTAWPASGTSSRPRPSRPT